MSLGTPSAQAFRFVLDGQGQKYDAYMDLHEHDGSLFVLDVRYRRQNAVGDKWTFLMAPEFDDSEIGNETTILIEFENLLREKINPKIEEVFGASAEKPVKGWELVQWYVSFGLEENNNVISLAKLTN